MQATCNNIQSKMYDMGYRARIASRMLALADGDTKRKAIVSTAQSIHKQQSLIFAANEEDLKAGRLKALSDAMLDRLALDKTRISAIKDSLYAIADQPDPVGEIMASWHRPSGLRIKRIRTPIGVIGVIYESRPNVTVDAGALCIKSGNAVILRGGTDSFYSSKALHSCMMNGLSDAGLPLDCVQIVASRDRALVGEMLKLTEYIDVIVPRGGKNLVGRIQEEARVPVFAHLEGICHVYVDRHADIEKARRVVLNAKTRRAGICGAAECLLIDCAIWEEFGIVLVKDLIEAGVEVRADSLLASIEGTIPACPDDFGYEFLDMKIAACVVDGVDGAIAHIDKHGSGHTDAIITECAHTKAQFFNKLDSAILMCNASTQFADGGEFGMGAEIGIATGKIHARGPVGSVQLTSFKYLVEGDGTIRK